MRSTTTLAERADLTHQVDWAMLTTRAVLDKAHDQVVGLISVDDNDGDGFLLQLDEGLEPALAADEIIFVEKRFALISTIGVCPLGA